MNSKQLSLIRILLSMGIELRCAICGEPFEPDPSAKRVTSDLPPGLPKGWWSHRSIFGGPRKLYCPNAKCVPHARSKVKRKRNDEDEA